MIESSSIGLNHFLLLQVSSYMSDHVLSTFPVKIRGGACFFGLVQWEDLVLYCVFAIYGSSIKKALAFTI